MLKLAVFAPMPSVSVTNATAVKPGLRFSCLQPYCASLKSVSNIGIPRFSEHERRVRDHFVPLLAMQATPHPSRAGG